MIWRCINYILIRSTVRLHNEGEKVNWTLNRTINLCISSLLQKEKNQSYSWDAWKKVKITFIFQGIFPIQGLNPHFLCLLHWQVDSSATGGFFSNCATWKAQCLTIYFKINFTYGFWGRTHFWTWECFIWLWDKSLHFIYQLYEVKSLSRARFFATPWTVAYQASPSTGFSRQEYWTALPFPSPGDLPDPGIEPGSPALQADALTSEPPGKHRLYTCKSNPFESFLLQFCSAYMKCTIYSKTGIFQTPL